MTPAIIYSLFFIVAGFINSLGVSSYLYFDSESYLIFIASYIVPTLVLSVRENQKCARYYQPNIAVLYYLWLIFVFIDFLMAGYVPLFSVISGVGSYTDFKPPLHGLTNAFSLVYLCGLPFSNEESKKLKLVIVVGYQLIILNRGPAIYHLIAYLVGVFSLIIAQKGLGHALSKILVTSIIIVVFFGFLGNLRSADVQIIKDIFGVNPEYYWLPDALLWVLIYFTSPFSNLLYNISLDDVSCTSGMLSTLSGMVPGFLRNDLLQHDVDTGFNLPCETTGNLYYPGLNVSTGFVQFFIDYGLVGFLMFSVLTSFVFRRLSKNGMENWDAFSSLFCVLLFVNIFAPSFTQLSFVISFLILMLFSRRICAA